MNENETPTGGTVESKSSERLWRRRPALLAAICVGVVMAALMALLATRNPVGDRITGANLIGKRAPAVDGEVVLGEPFDLGASDRWVVVNFFATWCVPCIKEHPELRAFDDAASKEGNARVISVVYDESSAKVREFFKRNGGDWTVFGADKGRTAVDWGVSKVPESYLVSPSGIVVERFVGGVTKKGLDAVIASYEQGAQQ